MYLKIDLHSVCITRPRANEAQRLSIAQSTCSKWSLENKLRNRFAKRQQLTCRAHCCCWGLSAYRTFTPGGEDRRWLQASSSPIPRTEQPSVVGTFQVPSRRVLFSPVWCKRSPVCVLQNCSEVQTKAQCMRINEICFRATSLGQK